MAEYMAAFSAMLGEPGELYFADIRENCTAIAISAAKGESLSRAKARAIKLAHRCGPPEARRAYDKIANMAFEDRRPARVADAASVILHFPKTPRCEKRPLRLRDTGHVTGELSAILRTRDGIKARIRPLDGGRYVECVVGEEAARQMRGHLLEVVRVSGPGWWQRFEGGGWFCEELIQIEQVARVETIGLRDAIDRLREQEINWPEDPLDSLAAIG